MTPDYTKVNLSDPWFMDMIYWRDVTHIYYNKL